MTAPPDLNEPEIQVFNKLEQQNLLQTKLQKLDALNRMHLKRLGIRVTFILNNPRRNAGIGVFTILPSHGDLDFVPSTEQP